MFAEHCAKPAVMWMYAALEASRRCTYPLRTVATRSCWLKRYWTPAAMPTYKTIYRVRQRCTVSLDRWRIRRQNSLTLRWERFSCWPEKQTSTCTTTDAEHRHTGFPLRDAISSSASRYCITFVLHSRFPNYHIFIYGTYFSLYFYERTSIVIFQTFTVTWLHRKQGDQI